MPINSGKINFFAPFIARLELAIPVSRISSVHFHAVMAAANILRLMNTPIRIRH